jgi:hypothetical protein
VVKPGSLAHILEFIGTSTHITSETLAQIALLENLQNMILSAQWVGFSSFLKIYLCTTTSVIWPQPTYVIQRPYLRTYCTSDGQIGATAATSQSAETLDPDRRRQRIRALDIHLKFLSSDVCVQ